MNTQDSPKVSAVSCILRALPIDVFIHLVAVLKLTILRVIGDDAVIASSVLWLAVFGGVRIPAFVSESSGRRQILYVGLVCVFYFAVWVSLIFCKDLLTKCLLYVGWSALQELMFNFTSPRNYDWKVLRRLAIHIYPFFVICVLGQPVFREVAHAFVILLSTIFACGAVCLSVSTKGLNIYECQLLWYQIGVAFHHSILPPFVTQKLAIPLIGGILLTSFLAASESSSLTAFTLLPLPAFLVVDWITKEFGASIHPLYAYELVCVCSFLVWCAIIELFDRKATIEGAGGGGGNLMIGTDDQTNLKLTLKLVYDTATFVGVYVYTTRSAFEMIT